MYVLTWINESGDRGIEGIWQKSLTVPEQHSYLKTNYPDDYGQNADHIHWDMISLDLKPAFDSTEMAEFEKMELVIVESPYAGSIETNERYARAAMRDCLIRGEAPYASHLLYTQPGVLKDAEPEERRLGINGGHAWMLAAHKVVVYTDLGISRGMELGIKRAEAIKKPIEMRKLPGWELA